MAGKGSSTSMGNQDSELKKSLLILNKKMEAHRAKIESLQSNQVSKPCIYRVPDKLRKLNVPAYSPCAVSIGPLHRGKKHLKAMESDKLVYTHSLFCRTERNYPVKRTFAHIQEECLEAMLGIEEEVRKKYAEEVKPEKREEFAVMMLIDGCFIIELLYNRYKRVGNSILNNTFKRLAVRHDLLLLENQIPFIVLQTLFSLTVKRCIIQDNNHLPEDCDLYDCVLLFFGNMMRLEDGKKIEKKDDRTYHHILDVLRNCYLPEEPVKDKGKENTCIPTPDFCKREEPKKDDKKFKSSATTLDLAGVKLKGVNKNNLFHLEFRTVCCFPFCKREFRTACCHLGLFRRARLEIPSISIYDSTEPFLRNLIAFEQCCPRIPRHFSSFAVLMDTLINSEKDIQLLDEGGVISNHLGSNDEAKELFNNICKHVAPDKVLYFEKECKPVQDYCGKSMPKFLTTLNRDYFASPWSVISFSAAMVLFALTVLQTVYTLLSYY